MPVPEMGRSVFAIPPEFFNRKHVLILNDRAWAIVESKRGEHEQYVFTWEGPNHERNRVGTINTAAFQKARADVGLAQVRGQRLRDAGVMEEDRSLLPRPCHRRHAPALRHGYRRPAGGSCK